MKNKDLDNSINVSEVDKSPTSTVSEDDLTREFVFEQSPHPVNPPPGRAKRRNSQETEVTRRVRSRSESSRNLLSL